jgi:hypothetical protein
MVPGWTQNGPRMAPEWPRNGPSMGPEWTQNGPKMSPEIWPEMDPKWARGEGGRLLEKLLFDDHPRMSRNMTCPLLLILAPHSSPPTPYTFPSSSSSLSSSHILPHPHPDPHPSSHRIAHIRVLPTPYIYNRSYQDCNGQHRGRRWRRWKWRVRGRRWKRSFFLRRFKRTKLQTICLCFTKPDMLMLRLYKTRQTYRD